MKRIICGITVSLLAVSSADAALLSRAGGDAYYDTALDITWLADANYVQTSGYDIGLFMTWDEAQSWIGSLNAEAGGAGHLGANNWRLPETLQPDTSCSHQSFLGQSYGYGCTGSEMGHLLNVDGISFNFPDPFSNVQPWGYWSGTSYAPDTSYAWYFNLSFAGLAKGDQDIRDKESGAFSASWAVRDGDIGAVPAPGALWLFGTGLAALGAKLKRRARGAGITA